jgi:hypothetical protein
LAISLSVWIKSQPNPKATEKEGEDLSPLRQFGLRLNESRSVGRELSYRGTTRRVRDAFPGGTWNALMAFGLTRWRTHGPHLEHASFHPCYRVFRCGRGVFSRHAAEFQLNREKLLSIPAFAWGYRYWRHMMDVIESMEVWKASRRLAADAARMVRSRWSQYKRAQRLSRLPYHS